MSFGQKISLGRPGEGFRRVRGTRNRGDLATAQGRAGSAALLDDLFGGVSFGSQIVYFFPKTLGVKVLINGAITIQRPTDMQVNAM